MSLPYPSCIASLLRVGLCHKAFRGVYRNRDERGKPAHERSLLSGMAGADSLFDLSRRSVWQFLTSASAARLGSASFLSQS
jgi:hypothetical protein